jgi:serpin B
MDKRLKLIICFLLIFMMILTSCASAPIDLMNGIKPDNGGRLPENMNQKLSQSILNFAWNMFKENSKNDGNMMISPPSIYLALAMTLNGADGETKDAMLNALSAQGISSEELNIGLNDWMGYLMSDNRIAKLSIANSIWYRDGFEAEERFLQSNADYYNATVKSLDFNDKSAVDEINKWVKNSTNNTIDKIVEQIGEDTIMYLINAIYFKGDWKNEFDGNKTRKSIFYAPDKEVEADFMNRRGEIKYLKGNDATGVILPYKDEQFAFVGLLPDEGISPRELINNFNALDLGLLIKSSEEKTIELTLPKFESSYEDGLVDELSKLGMEIAFDPYNADFSLMQQNRNKDLAISEVKHKTFIKVDEKGTEASAVTSVAVDATSMPVEVPKIVFDRPFIYSVIDVMTGIPLFIGIMENPVLQ